MFVWHSRCGPPVLRRSAHYLRTGTWTQPWQFVAPFCVATPQSRLAAWPLFAQPKRSPTTRPSTACPTQPSTRTAFGGRLRLTLGLTDTHMQPTRFLTYAAAFVCIALIALYFIVSRHESTLAPCEDTTTGLSSPSKQYLAEVVSHTCAWGFGQAASTLTVKVTRLGANGWYFTLPLEFDPLSDDQGLPGPRAEWTAENTLVITTESRSVSGILELTRHPLIVVRRYIKARTSPTAGSQSQPGAS